MTKLEKSHDHITTNIVEASGSGTDHSMSVAPRPPGTPSGDARDQEKTVPALTALIYLRVSTARQAEKGGEAEGYSIPVQREGCTRKASDLGATVQQEFVDAGASARSADRPALQAMLEHLKSGGVDYVIVHKVDRLARDRADDVMIALAIHKAGAKLISVTEAVDATPAGTLLHGIMAAISEFYSNNLSQEAKKGLHEKARRGGTPSYAPLGYLNATTHIDGREVKTVIIDKERSSHIRWAFESYATGEWSISELTEELERQGLKSRPTRKFVGSPLNRAQVHRMLSNPYYTGKLKYGGIIYDGKHEPLIDDETFSEVQAVLSARRIAGDRSWRRQQYLKGTVYCNRCGSRLGYGHSRGRHGGEYPYFFCLGRHLKRNSCDLPYLAAHRVEAAVMGVWDDATFTPLLTELVTEAVDSEFAVMRTHDSRTLATQKRRVIALERQRQKLIDAYLAGAIPVEDIKQRQEQLQSELLTAKRLITQASAHHEEVKNRLDAGLQLLSCAGELYRQCPDETRQILNQVFYDAMLVDTGSDGSTFVAGVEAKPELEALIRFADGVLSTLESGSVTASTSMNGHRGRDVQFRLPPRCDRRLLQSPMKPSGYRDGRAPLSQGQENPGQRTAGQGSNLSYLAERVGFEPTVSFPTHDFQSCRFGRSRTPPASRQASLKVPHTLGLSRNRAWCRARRSGSAQRGAANRVRA
jgi:site-specific DNA recombinase